MPMTFSRRLFVSGAAAAVGGFAATANATQAAPSSHTSARAPPRAPWTSPRITYRG
jgi:hypothetical protein